MANHNTASMRKCITTAGLTCILMIAGCSSGPTDHFPDSKAAANKALEQGNFRAVSVSQDRTKGVMILTGTLPTLTEKVEAENDVRKAAPKYTIANEISVVPAPSQAEAMTPEDIAIQDRFNDAVKKNRSLADDHISIKATQGDVMLSGTVRTAFDKREAEKLAKAIPNVHKVENNLKINAHQR